LSRLLDLLHLFRVEVQSQYRDRQALLYGVLLPVTLYPLLLFGLMQATSISAGLTERIPSRVLLSHPPSWMKDALSSAGLHLETRLDLDNAGIRQRLHEGSLDAAVRVSSEEEKTVLQITYDSSQERSLEAEYRIVSCMESVRANRIIRWLRERGFRPEDLPSIEEVSVTSSRQMGGFALSLFLPGFLLVVATMAVSHPAIDVTVGERERNTWETTLLLPVPRAWIVASKLFAVVIMALGAVALNLASMSLSIQHLVSVLQVDALDVTPSPSQVLLLLLAAGTYALLMGSVMILISTRASHFSEAQSLVAPLYLVSILPGFLSTISTLHLDRTTAWIPLLNVSLAFKGILSHSLRGTPFLIHLLLSSLLACFFTAWASRAVRRQPLQEGAARE